MLDKDRESSRGQESSRAAITTHQANGLLSQQELPSLSLSDTDFLQEVFPLLVHPKLPWDMINKSQIIYSKTLEMVKEAYIISKIC